MTANQTNGPRRLGFGVGPLLMDERMDRGEALRLLEAVLRSDLMLVDAADTYGPAAHGPHWGEQLLREAADHAGELRPLLATKAGAVRAASGRWEIDGCPQRLRRLIVASHRALGGERAIPLWQHHWPDPRHSVTSVMQMAAQAVSDGLIERVGVCNYSVEQLEEARQVVDVFSVQNQFNFWHRGDADNGLLDYCRRQHVWYLAWRPFGGPGLAHRLDEIDALRAAAAAHGCNVHQAALAWLWSVSPQMVPLPGTTRLPHFRECLAARTVRLSDGEAAAAGRADVRGLRRKRPPAWTGSPPLSARKTDSE